MGHVETVIFVNQANETAKQIFAKRRADQALLRARRPQIQAEGEAALRRLFNVAQGDTGQCGRIARFLLGLYNGPRFPFDMTELRGLDHALFADCIAVLRMDYAPEREVHRYFENGGREFERLAVRWTDDQAAAGAERTNAG